MKDVIEFETIDEHGPQTYRATFDVSAEELGRDEVAGLGSVTIDTTVDRGDLEGEYLAEGTVNFTADLTCS